LHWHWQGPGKMALAHRLRLALAVQVATLTADPSRICTCDSVWVVMSLDNPEKLVA